MFYLDRETVGKPGLYDVVRIVLVSVEGKEIEFTLCSATIVKENDSMITIAGKYDDPNPNRLQDVEFKR
ncbi:hypothetical protein [Thermoflavimicrobium dichotomicum]|uniref:hypothetical protein n=1 Tax=Thermoflavimicrobium dichotomicum TaxID=46223 RepID=UPI0011144F73|nr:hypothetical protein [Thermoflavimicrobium dichotomicum]